MFLLILCLACWKSRQAVQQVAELYGVSEEAGTYRALRHHGKPKATLIQGKLSAPWLDEIVNTVKGLGVVL
ncbi:hypothetical protein [Endozoicomonas sp. 2B-B]